MSDTAPGASEPAGGTMKSDSGAPREIEVPPEALEPSGRSEESLPKTAPTPGTGDVQTDPQDGSTEIPPVTPDV